MSDTLYSNPPGISSEATSAQIQELNDLKIFLEKQKEQYRKQKILYHAIEDCISEGSPLDDALKSKIQDILLGEKVKTALPIETEGSGASATTLLGVQIDNDIKLNYVETSTLKKSLESRIGEEYHVITRCSDLSKSAQSQKPEFQLNRQDSDLFDLRKDLYQKRMSYIDNLLEEQEILESLIQVRLDELPSVARDRLKRSKLQSKMNELRAAILKQKARVDIFTENGTLSFEAYKKILEDIAEQQEECKQDIRELEELKEKYRKVSCKQYDELLKTFIEYKVSLEKKQIMLKSVFS